MTKLGKEYQIKKTIKKIRHSIKDSTQVEPRE